MKKALSLLAIFAILSLALSSCTPPQDKAGVVTVVIGTETPTEHVLEFEEGDITNGLFSVLDELELSYTTDSYGMLASVGDLVPTPPTYIYLYTSVAEDFDVSQYALTMKYGTYTLTSSGVGAKDMHITDGAVIYIGTITW